MAKGFATDVIAPSWLARMLFSRSETLLAAIILVVLLATNLVLNPVWLDPSHWGTVIGLATPLAVAAIATMPSILGGRGGIDVSIGPLMGFINAILVKTLITDLGITTPVTLVAAALAIGMLVGAMNGFLAAFVRVQPIVATLGTSMLLTGLTLTVLPSPMGTIPEWLRALSGQFAALPLLVLAMLWLALKRTPYYEQLMAVGSDDRACFTAGIHVATARFLSYVLGGLFAGVAGLSLTALIGSADPTVGPNFTLIAISAVALGGVSLAGGRGGFSAAVIGAVDIFLLQSALTYFNVSSFVLQVTYGLILVASISLNAVFGRLERSAAR